jgi:hypothetical protein
MKGSFWMERLMPNLTIGFPRHLDKQAKRVEEAHLLGIPAADVQELWVTHEYG